MKLVRNILQFIGFRQIQSQLLLLISVLFLSGFIAMVIIYSGMRADAVTINIAGKQRMLSQRVAKEALLVQAGLGEAKDTQKTIEQFEVAMQWLIAGNKSKGISAPSTIEIKSQLEKVNQLWRVYQKDILLLQSNESPPIADKMDIKKRVFETSPNILKEMNRAVQMMETQSNADVKHNMHLSLALISLLLLLSGCFYLYVRNFLMKPLLPLRDALKTLSKGDLTVYLPEENTQDEIGMLYNDYNDVLKDISSILSNVVQTSEQLGTSSLQLKTAASSSADGMDKQYQEIEMISTAMNEISATILEVASSSAQASEYTDNAQLEATSGRAMVTQATQTIDELNQDVQSVGDTIKVLNENSLNISKVLDVINEIAAQTNLLALNAAIEAARAGESGRGFAVVADEVRGLAARTANSTHEIQQMVERLQNQAKESVAAINTSQEKAAMGVVKMHQADTALERIVDAVMAINEMNTHIASATKEESEVANDMNRRIVHVAETSNKTRTNAANNRELAGHLSQIGDALSRETVRFTL